jgi:CheY-like chemotaxis protein
MLGLGVNNSTRYGINMAEQTNYLLLLVEFFSGVLLFVLAVVLFKGKLSAMKRKKTKLGLVKVAGAGLKLDDEEPAAAEQQSAAADAGVVTAAAADEPADSGGPVDTDADPAVNADTGSGADSVKADPGVAADEPKDSAVPDDPADFGENAEYAETLAVPIGAVDAEDDDEADRLPEPPPPEKLSVKHTVGDSKGYSNVRIINKDIDKPSENPFIGGRFSVVRDESAKKTHTPIQRRRLPETVKMKDRKVILAEDVAINRELIAMYFDGSGVKFDFAVNGREVCEKFERDPGAYSLILMDIQMPEMDGYQVSRKIRSMDTEWAKQIPIIALTGNDKKEEIDACFDAGMDDHISKPIDMELLQEKVFDIITLNAE